MSFPQLEMTQNSFVRLYLIFYLENIIPSVLQKKKTELVVSTFKSVFHVLSATQTLGFYFYCVIQYSKNYIFYIDNVWYAGDNDKFLELSLPTK